MAFAAHAGAALLRSEASFGENAESPSIDPWALAFGADGEAPRFPEIDCLRSEIAPGTLAAAEDRAATLAVGADRVLIAAGTLSEEAYLRTLGKHLDQARRQSGEDLQQLQTTDTLADHHRARTINPVHLEDRLRNIQTNRANLAHGRLPSMWFATTQPP